MSTILNRGTEGLAAWPSAGRVYINNNIKIGSVWEVDFYFLKILKYSLVVFEVTLSNNLQGADGDLRVSGVTPNVPFGATSFR